SSHPLIFRPYIPHGAYWYESGCLQGESKTLGKRNSRHLAVRQGLAWRPAARGRNVPLGKRRSGSLFFVQGLAHGPEQHAGRAGFMEKVTLGSVKELRVFANHLRAVSAHKDHL